MFVTPYLLLSGFPSCVCVLILWGTNRKRSLSVLILLAVSYPQSLRWSRPSSIFPCRWGTALFLPRASLQKLLIAPADIRTLVPGGAAVGCLCTFCGIIGPKQHRSVASRNNPKSLGSGASDKKQALAWFCTGCVRWQVDSRQNTHSYKNVCSFS